MISIIEIIWIILASIALFVFYIIGVKFVKVINNKTIMQRDFRMCSVKFSEQEILSHLDFIIGECLDYYIAMRLTPKNYYYINSKIETEMINSLSETVSNRISPVLYSQLSLIYDSNQIASVIGERIYIKVLDYVIQFNIENEGKNKKIK